MNTNKCYLLIFLIVFMLICYLYVANILIIIFNANYFLLFNIKYIFAYRLLVKQQFI